MCTEDPRDTEIEAAQWYAEQAALSLIASRPLEALPVARVDLWQLRHGDSKATLVKNCLQEAAQRGIQARIERDFEELDYSELMATLRGKG